MTLSKFALVGWVLTFLICLITDIQVSKPLFLFVLANVILNLLLAIALLKRVSSQRN